MTPLYTPSIDPRYAGQRYTLATPQIADEPRFAAPQFRLRLTVSKAGIEKVCPPGCVMRKQRGMTCWPPVSHGVLCPGARLVAGQRTGYCRRDISNRAADGLVVFKTTTDLTVEDYSSKLLVILLHEIRTNDQIPLERTREHRDFRDASRI
jgi:hypothetical protein